MRRALSSLLLVLFSYMLMAPLAIAKTQTVPDCCRKAGKHQCAMSSPAHHTAAGVGITESKRCPFFPVASTAPGQASIGGCPVSSQPRAVTLFHRASGTVQTEARYRVSHARSCQKRGPPLSSPSSLAC